jgi:hypothetical protein
LLWIGAGFGDVGVDIRFLGGKRKNKYKCDNKGKIRDLQFSQFPEMTKWKFSAGCGHYPEFSSDPFGMNILQTQKTANH